MLSELQIGYLAGILDGEGQVSIIKNRRKDDRKRVRDYALRSQVCISQRRRRLLDAIQEWTGGTANSTIGRTGKNNAYYSLRFKSGWLRDNLPLIIPHLILKRRQAEIVLRFVNNPDRPGRRGVGEEEWAIRDKLHAEVRALNADRSNGED